MTQKEGLDPWFLPFCVFYVFCGPDIQGFFGWLAGNPGINAWVAASRGSGSLSQGCEQTGAIRTVHARGCVERGLEPRGRGRNAVALRMGASGRRNG